MKFPLARISIFALCALAVSAVLLLAQQSVVVAGDGRHRVRMPVDPRIIEFEGSDEALTRMEEKRDNASMPAQPAVKPAKGVKRGNGAPKAKVPTPASKPKRTEKPAPGHDPKRADTPKPAPKAERKPSPGQPAKAERTSPAKRPGPAGGTITKFGVKKAAKGFFTVHVTGDAPMGKVTYFWLRNPTRLVVDIQGRWQLHARNVVRVNQGKVKHVVVGEHHDKLRLVVHFHTPPRTMGKPVIRVQGNGVDISAPAE